MGGDGGYLWVVTQRRGRPPSPRCSLAVGWFCPKPLTGMRKGTEGRTRVIEGYF